MSDGAVSLQPKTSDGEILPLTGLRFVAAFFVFLFHIQIRWPMPIGGFGQRLVGHGAAGMSLFFILSGYVLSYRYYRSGLNLREYAWNRIGRIYPIYLLAAVLSLPFLYIGVRNAPDAWAKLLALLFADASATQAWFPPMFNYWNNGGSWSISAEAFFYVSFPAVLWVVKRARSLWAVMACAYGAAALPGLVYLAFSDQMTHGLEILYAMPIFRLGEFALGVGLYALSQERPIAHPNLLFWAPLAVLVAYFGFRSDTGIYVSDNWVVVPAIGSIVLATGSGESVAAHALGSRPMVWLGKISYCFYSFQVVLMLVLMGYSHRYGGPPIADHLALMAESALGLIIASGIGYHVIEEPMRKRIRAFGRAPNKAEPIPIV